MNIAEISPAHLRGRLLSVGQLNIVSRILLAFFSDYVVAEIVETTAAWRWMFGVEAVPAAIFIVLIWFIPQSPDGLSRGDGPIRLELCSDDWAKRTWKLSWRRSWRR